MSDNKDGFEIGDLSVDVDRDGSSIWFAPIGDPYETAVLGIKDLNEFYEKLGEIVEHVNSNK